MLQKIRRFTAVAAVSLALTSGLPAAAGPFSSLFVFGDSLVDTGNVFAATGGAVPPAPYANGRFSNGPVWVETLADGLGLTPDAAPVLLGGNNYAFGGARTGASGGVPGLLAQVGALWAPTHAMADPDALYVISAGSNDMRDARNNFPDTTPTDEDGRAAAAEAAIGNIYASLQGLAARGARHVLIANVADLGLTPESAQPGFPPRSVSTDASNQFNMQLAGLEALAEFDFGLDISILDIVGFQRAVTNDALTNGGGVYGITNVVLPCGDFFGPMGPSCDASLYSDGLHPTAAAHRYIGRAALALLGVSSTVPAPAALTLFGFAFGLLCLSRRRYVGQHPAAA